jgi:ribosome biogenesis GTPase
MPVETPVNAPASADPGCAELFPPSRRRGLAIVNYGTSVLVEDEAGGLHRCVARRRLHPVVSGDRVTWELSGVQQGIIHAVEPRRTILERADGANRIRPLAANIDQILVVVAPQPAHDTFLIDRYLVATELAGAVPLLVFNKSDLLVLPDAVPEDELRDFITIGYTVLLTSAHDNDGIEELTRALAGRTSILVGQSGVGKSSLIKRLLPELDIQIGRLSTASGQGIHTTTCTTLYHLPQGGELIDSPGVRDFRLGETSPDELARGFREFRPYLGSCRFPDCRHLSEPGCAVKEALRAGAISQRRMASYRNLMGRSQALS